MNSCNTTEVSPDLNQLDYEDFLQDDIPVTLYLSVLCVLGSLGNLHVFILYFKRYNGSNHHVFILILAGVDFLACSVCLPYEIVDIYKSFSFTNGGVCKFFRFLIHFTSLGSGFMLVLIALERYRKLCAPFGRQIVGHEIHVLCSIMLGLSLVISIPSFVFYGAEVKVIPGYEHFTGSDCTSLRAYKYSFIYYAVMLFISTLMFIVCVVMYSVVGKVLFSHYSKKKEQTATIPVHEDRAHDNESSDCIESLTSPPQSPGNTLDKHDKHAVLGSQKSILERLKSMSVKNPLKTQNSTDKNTARAKMRLDRTMHITLMLLVATAISYLGYIPAIIASILNTVAPHAVSQDIDSFMSVLTRGFYLNHVVNPVVFFLMDKKLRKDAKKMYKKLWKRVRRCKLKK